MEETDIHIIGCGPAGAQAALYLAARGISSRCTGRPDLSRHAGTELPDVLGSPGPESGSALIRRAMERAAAMGARIMEGEVVDIREENGSYVLEEDGGAVIRSGTIILATGLPVDAIPADLASKGVGDRLPEGFRHSGTPVVILGGGSRAIYTALELRGAGMRVHLVAGKISTTRHMEDRLADSDTNIHEGREVREVVAEGGRPTSVVLDGGRSLDCGIVMHLDGPRRPRELLWSMSTQLNSITVNERWETSLPSIYACGDLLGTVDAVTAGSQGALAAGSAFRAMGSGNDR